MRLSYRDGPLFCCCMVQFPLFITLLYHHYYYDSYIYIFLEQILGPVFEDSFTLLSFILTD